MENSSTRRFAFHAIYVWTQTTRLGTDTKSVAQGLPCPLPDKMKLYEFTLEIRDGEQEYILSRYVAANTLNAAVRFAKNTALHFQPNTRYDAHTDWYEAPVGYPIWRIDSIQEVNELHVPAADNTSIVTFTVQQFYRTDGPQARLRVLHTPDGTKPRAA